MSKKEDSRAKRVGNQVLKNVGASTAGAALGYFGAGSALNKLLKSKRVQNRLNSLTPLEKEKMLNRLKTVSGLTSSTAAGLSSIALYNALDKKQDSSEKVASFFTSYALRVLV